jgi:hypothetical protein
MVGMSGADVVSFAILSAIPDKPMTSMPPEWRAAEHQPKRDRAESDELRGEAERIGEEKQTKKRPPALPEGV